MCRGFTKKISLGKMEGRWTAWKISLFEFTFDVTASSLRIHFRTHIEYTFEFVSCFTPIPFLSLLRLHFRTHSDIIVEPTSNLRSDPLRVHFDITFELTSMLLSNSLRVHFRIHTDCTSERTFEVDPLSFSNSLRDYFGANFEFTSMSLSNSLRVYFLVHFDVTSISLST